MRYFCTQLNADKSFIIGEVDRTMYYDMEIDTTDWTATELAAHIRSGSCGEVLYMYVQGSPSARAKLYNDLKKLGKEIQ